MRLMTSKWNCMPKIIEIANLREWCMSDDDMTGNTPQRKIRESPVNLQSQALRSNSKTIDVIRIQGQGREEMERSRREPGLTDKSACFQAETVLVRELENVANDFGN